MIFNLHCRFDLSSDLGIDGACGTIKSLDPFFISCGEWNGTIINDVQFTKPHFKALTAKFINVGVAIDFNVILGLNNIDAIEHVQEPLALDWHCELFVEHIQQNIGGALVGSGVTIY
jgi:hypothetical protein